MSIPPYILRKLRKKQRRLIRRLILVTLVIIGLAIWLWPKYFPASSTASLPSSPPASGQTSSETGAFDRKKPSFNVLTPAGKSLDSLDGRTATPSSDGSVFVYVDTVGGAELRVSQQELPPNLATGTQTQLKTLAAGFNANRSITTPGDTTFYIGTSTDGPQSVITTKDGLLILIKSSTSLDDKQWSTYIDSLE